MTTHELPPPSYLCNCGRTFPEHLARVVHMASCAVMRTYRDLTELRDRVDAVFDLPQRPWSEDDADSPEARSARAYNHALATVRLLLRQPPDEPAQDGGQADSVCGHVEVYVNHGNETVGPFRCTRPAGHPDAHSDGRIGWYGGAANGGQADG